MGNSFALAAALVLGAALELAPAALRAEERDLDLSARHFHDLTPHDAGVWRDEKWTHRWDDGRGFHRHFVPHDAYYCDDPQRFHPHLGVCDDALRKDPAASPAE